VLTALKAKCSIAFIDEFLIVINAKFVQNNTLNDLNPKAKAMTLFDLILSISKFAF
jgi:hypothetical protein